LHLHVEILLFPQVLIFGDIFGEEEDDIGRDRQRGVLDLGRTGADGTSTAVRAAAPSNPWRNE
jgi:hypothetical protein